MANKLSVDQIEEFSVLAKALMGWLVQNPTSNLSVTFTFGNNKSTDCISALKDIVDKEK